jgi:hypothetical protein
MHLPPAVIVHGLAQARAALAPGLPVTLLSAPGAALYAGVGWWRALVAASCEGGASPPDILDCADAPGRALEALRHGQRILVLRAPTVFDDVAARAATQGAFVLPEAPDALDLAARGAARRLGAWLSGDPGSRLGWS